MKFNRSLTNLLYAAIGSLIVCSLAIAQPTATLDSLTGSAEVQRAGTVAWIPATRDEKLFNNDILRIAPEGFGIVRWPDNSAGYAHGGTQILINIGIHEKEKHLLSYATVFMGSVFFVIKKTLPKIYDEDIQIYTPTTVISIRGTSFELDVAQNSGTSTVKVLSGTVQVHCIAKNASAFISAPFKTVVAKQTSPVVPSALLSTDIDSLRQWVPSYVIDLEIARQLSKSKRDQLIISNKMYEKCLILPFTNTSTYAGSWDIGTLLPNYLAKKINASTNRLETHVGTPADTTGKNSATTPERFIITGKIDFLDIVNHAEITVRADEYRERAIGRITLTLELRDREHDGKDIFTTTVTGERSGKKSAENSWNVIQKLPFDPNNELFSSSIIGSAVEQAIDAATEKLITRIYE